MPGDDRDEPLSARLAQLAAEHCPDGVVWASLPEGTIVYVNDVVAGLLHASREDLLGTLLSDWDELAEPTSDERRGFGTFTRSLRRKTGGRVPVEIRANRFEVEGSGYLCAFVRDISDREELDETLRITRFSVDTSPDEAFWVDVTGRVQYANAAACASLGYSAEEMAALRLWDFVPRHDESSFANLMQRMKAMGRATFESEHQRKNGSLFPVEVSAFYFEFQGEPYLCGYGRDITARKRAEAEIKELNAELEARVARRTAQLESANEELETFVYSVSHDLRKPLRGIRSSVGLILDEAGDTTVDNLGDLLRIDSAARRMAELIDDLLTLSRVSRAELRVRRVDVSSLAAEVAATFREGEPEREVEVSIDQGIEACADPGLLRVVLENLLDNAWKFTSGIDGASIAVGGTASADATEIWVRDNGAGFDPAYADKLFRPFERLHTEAEFEGNGVGLATVARIIHKHGGEVWATGRPSEGATVHLTLPAGAQSA